MRPPPRQAVTAVILAGGDGRRLGGRDKAWLDWRRRALLRRVIRRLQPQAGTILVSTNRRLLRVRALGLRAVRDAPPSRSGPLAGWQAALNAARTPWLLSCPVDDPAPPLDLARRLARPLRGQSGAWARSPAGDHYLHALLARRLRRSLDAFRAGGGRAAGNWLLHAGLDAVAVPEKSTPWSLNQSADLRRLRRSR